MSQMTLEGTPSNQDRAANDFFEHLDKQMHSCSKCDLKVNTKDRQQTVGFGHKNNPIIAIVDGSAAKSFRETGHPFCGCGGKLLEETLNKHHINLFYYTTVTKCSPNNGVATPTQVEDCRYFLFRELNYARPKLIVAIGPSAVSALFGDTIKDFKLDGTTILHFRNIPVIPIHSADYAISNPTETFKLWNVPWSYIGDKYRSLINA